MQTVKEKADNYIASLGLSQEALTIVNAMHGLISIYAQDNTDHRREHFDEKLQPYFDQMVTEHLAHIDSSLHTFMETIVKKSVAVEDFERAINLLLQTIKSPAIEEAKEGGFTTLELKQLHTQIVTPLTNELIEMNNRIIRNIDQSHDVLMKQMSNNGHALADIIRETSASIKQAIGGVKSNLESINLPRSLR
jgi:hypothetical protein